MKVLIGVCGIGFGHSMRQREVAERLRAEGHEVEIASTEAVTPLFRALGFSTHDVWLPIVPGCNTGISLLRSITANVRSVHAGVATHTRLRRTLRREGVPDLFVTDYEPNVARLAYHFGRPLVSIDQQSKFRYFDFEPIGGYSQAEERARLSFFFPRLTHSFIVSFYKIPYQRPGVNVVPPILPREMRAARGDCGDRVVVYLSSYLGQGLTEQLHALAGLFGRYSNATFHVYLHRRDYDASTAPAQANVRTFSFDRDRFVEDLLACRGVITTAGHNLISEALWLKKPLYVVPLRTFDQHYCGKVVERYGFGMSRANVTEAGLDGFFAGLDRFSGNIRSSEILNYEGNSLDLISSFVNSRQWRN